MIIVVVAGLALAIFFLQQQGNVAVSNTQSSVQPAPDTLTKTVETTPISAATPEQQTMSAAQAVMVTADLSFPGTPPSIAEALLQIERRYGPQDGTGRTFAILDAYGEPTPDGKLHISMHVSSEKPGTGSLIFKRTGAVLWHSTITPGPNPPTTTKNLNIYVGDGAGATWILDGSGNPASVLESKVRDKKIAVRDFWPDGAEREVTFVYSACGCPVKAMIKRVGERTVRTKDLPVLFPDDPGVVQVVSRLMGW
jgi:hypothetical protein